MEPTEKAKLLAERLTAFLLHEEKSDKDASQNVLSTVLERLDQMNSRLGKIESELSAQSENAAKMSFTPSLPHPSLQQFEIKDAAQFLPHTNIKACTFEPNDKPCDNCAMCSSRGF